MNADLDEDVVADSEDDELLSQDMTELFSKSSVQSSGVTNNAGSLASTEIVTESVSNAFHFTKNSVTKPPQAPITPTTPAPSTKPRPRPRPAYNGAPGISSSDSGPVSSMGNGMSPICTSTTKSSPDVDRDDRIHSDGYLIYPLDIAERAKTRSRNSRNGIAPIVISPPSSTKQSSPLNRSSDSIPPIEVIDITSDEDDELALRPSKKKSKSKYTKVTPKRKPAKRTKTSHSTPTTPPDDPPLFSNPPTPHKDTGTASAPTSPTDEAGTNPDMPSALAPVVDVERKKGARKRKSRPCNDNVTPTDDADALVPSEVQKADDGGGDDEVIKPIVVVPQEKRINRKKKAVEPVVEPNDAPSEDKEVRPDDTAVKENLPCDVETPDANMQPPHSKTFLRSKTIVSRAKSTPMSELIRRVNSLPGSPFPSTARTSTTSTVYSPYLKSSRSVLSRIAPLHPNRRTPPPPPPRPPPPKKTKKQVEQEERWEEELSESVEGWACMADEERAALRMAKRAREEGWED